MSTVHDQFSPEAAENFVLAIKEARADGHGWTKKDIIAGVILTLGAGRVAKVPDSVRAYISQCVEFVMDALDKDPNADTKQVAQDFTRSVAPLAQQASQETMAEALRVVARALVDNAQDLRASSSVDQRGLVDSQNQLIESFIARSNLEGKVKDDVRQALQEVSVAKPEDADLLISRISPSIFGGVDSSVAGQDVEQPAQSATQAPTAETVVKKETSQEAPPPVVDQPAQHNAPEASKPRKLTKPKPSMKVSVAMRRNLQGNCPDGVEKVIIAELSGWLSSKPSTAKQIANFNEGFDLAMKAVAEAIVPLEHEQALQSIRALKSVLEDPATCTAEKSISTQSYSPKFEAVQKFCAQLASNPQCTQNLRNGAIDILSGWEGVQSVIKRRKASKTQGA